MREDEVKDRNPRDVWETIGERDPYCGTGGPTRAVPKLGKFAEPDTELFNVVHPAGLVLDVGSGYGRNCIPLAKLGCQILACDISLHMSSTVRENGVPFILCDLRKLPFRDLSFDYLICSVVLIHLKRGEVDRAVSELKRVGKQLLIIMPNPLGPASLFGLKPLLVGLVIWAKRRPGSVRVAFQDIPCPRGYLVNFYLPWEFRSLLRRQFSHTSVRSAKHGWLPHPYLTDRLLFVCTTVGPR